MKLNVRKQFSAKNFNRTFEKKSFINSFQLTNRNILNDEKENSVEKNLRQNLNPRSPLGGVVKEKVSLRPALRTIAIQKQAHQVQLQQQQVTIQRTKLQLYSAHFIIQSMPITMLDCQIIWLDKNTCIVKPTLILLAFKMPYFIEYISKKF